MPTTTDETTSKVYDLAAYLLVQGGYRTADESGGGLITDAGLKALRYSEMMDRLILEAYAHVAGMLGQPAFITAIRNGHPVNEAELSISLRGLAEAGLLVRTRTGYALTDAGMAEVTAYRQRPGADRDAFMRGHRHHDPSRAEDPQALAKCLHPSNQRPDLQLVTRAIPADPQIEIAMQCPHCENYITLTVEGS
jgi:hypothetical protein